ncbi:darcynin-like uncharacterized protein [Shimia isoporae]|uniref:Darcynin-like uncharacterized protein n=1 Tax=Shimia isoporae TaxID=647720 RepID=A0A4R1N1D8_9RHOB|nr:darcynin family protein [Shimia isoporae]TCK99756.1 darcynin-like uncharacterized protein [Shimia isoporae]
MNWTIFVSLRATPKWLSLSLKERDQIASSCLGQAATDERVKMRFYDAEAFSGVCSDLAVFETDDMGSYYFVMERFRNTALLSEPYFEILDIIPALENGFQAFQESELARST